MVATKPELTTDKQILYLVQWFAEFSEFQRGDFLADHMLPMFGPFLAKKILVSSDSETNGLSEEDKVTNGVKEIDLNNSDPRPPSIFQCRMKLFTEWYRSWSESDRIEFLLRFKNIDSGFLSEFYRLLLHRNDINSFDELQARLKKDEETLLGRLELNEKVFESKIPEILTHYPTVTLGETASTTPDLLTDVVGIKCETSSGSNSIEENPESVEEEIQEVIMEGTEDDVDGKDPKVADEVESKTETVPNVESKVEESQVEEPAQTVTTDPIDAQPDVVA
ncbi:hypothetical protein TYRP_000699 [Tyrophagus putrescentiae]|nr:hypothetical protein TYRP_000699 [Tyrophagus putrescentiae]